MINVIAKPPFEVRHLMRVSSIIRGEQLCAYMGNCRLNPPDGKEDDIYVYVKPNIRPSQDFEFEKHSWIDIHDGFDLRHTLRKYPEVGCISISDHADYVIKQYVKNKTVIIPHHHCNFERAKRNDLNGILNVGITGSPQAFDAIPEEIKKGLADRGINLITWSNFYPRTSVAKFHSKIDIHLQWRPWRKQLSSPLKITNAASFGVPTIALTSIPDCLDLEPSFYEMDGCYVGVSNPKEWLEQLDSLGSPSGTTPKYKEMAKVCLEKAEKYHIDNISKLYEQLT